MKVEVKRTEGDVLYQRWFIYFRVIEQVVADDLEDYLTDISHEIMFYLWGI